MGAVVYEFLIIMHVLNMSTVKLVISSDPREAQKWLFRSDGWLTEVGISTKIKLRNILFGCFRQIGCLIKVTANSGFAVL